MLICKIAAQTEEFLNIKRLKTHCRVHFKEMNFFSRNDVEQMIIYQHLPCFLRKVSNYLRENSEMNKGLVHPVSMCGNNAATKSPEM